MLMGLFVVLGVLLIAAEWVGSSFKRPYSLRAQKTNEQD
jgi:hypothetical protein